MGQSLRVDPQRLRSAAQAQSEVGDYVAAMDTGRSMAGAAAGVSGLLTAGACELAGSVLDAALSAVHEELSGHSDKLSSAADIYQRTDAELARELSKFGR